MGLPTAISVDSPPRFTRFNRNLLNPLRICPFCSSDATFSGLVNEKSGKEHTPMYIRSLLFLTGALLLAARAFAQSTVNSRR